MGLFDKLFGGKNPKPSDSTKKPELRLEYNVMKNIQLATSPKYENADQYKLVEHGIYIELNDEDGMDAAYRTTISYELEENDNNNQYPLEDILDKYLLHVSDFYETENIVETNKFKLELGGALDDVLKSHEIIGKKVFNREYLYNGQIRVDLVIE